MTLSALGLMIRLTSVWSWTSINPGDMARPLASEARPAAAEAGQGSGFGGLLQKIPSVHRFIHARSFRHKSERPYSLESADSSQAGSDRMSGETRGRDSLDRVLIKN